MSDQPNDPNDELLRAALRAEVDDVTAGADLLDRIHAAKRTSSGPSRTAPWLLAAAVAAVVIGIGATVALRDDDQTVDIVDDPSGPTTTTTGQEPGSMFDRLAKLFERGDLDSALKHSIPIDNDFVNSMKQKGLVSLSWKLPENLVDYSFNRLNYGGSGPAVLGS
jgi:hypothetical protein